ncbi:hypothetical protein E1281_36560 [Actinomadura sp. KC345]|uniref:hypothetical protein n=1 Tax=Actinomadura sp. KC345 TaxID=2530371 RepID=UPI00104CBDDC|nr:hypothetical protein [Actinomadura sp. KC345]TDC42135.1 hypothetical protein E1281_36560 [Actinomadura sp. KC345]
MDAVQADDLPELHSLRHRPPPRLRRRTSLTLNHSSGRVDGHVKRIKMIKQQVYGRADPALLRKRIPLADQPAHGM